MRPGRREVVGGGSRVVAVSGFRVWLDRALSLVTALLVVVASYVVVAERLIPYLRKDPVPVGTGETLAEPLHFEALTGGRASSRAGAELRLPAGRPVLLLVFSSRCPACYANLPAWKRVLEERDDRVSVVAVGLERSRQAVTAYAAQYLPGATAAVPWRPQRFAETLGIEVVPFTALVDSAGTLLFSRQGSLDSLGVSALITALGALRGSSTP